MNKKGYVMDKEKVSCIEFIDVEDDDYIETDDKGNALEDDFYSSDKEIDEDIGPGMSKPLQVHVKFGKAEVKMEANSHATVNLFALASQLWNQKK